MLYVKEVITLNITGPITNDIYLIANIIIMFGAWAVICRSIIISLSPMEGTYKDTLVFSPKIDG